MQLIKENFDHDFNIDKRGLFAIFITARCRCGEDLKIEIDGKPFREIPPEKNIQSYNIPASWNGTKLKGLKKTVVFILWLEKGNHKISFVPYKGAKLEGLKIKELGQNVKHSVFDINEQAEDGDRRPWYTFALIDLPLKHLSIEATVQKRFWDSDDVKIIIDGKIRKNIRERKYKFWYFVGGILPWIIWRIVGKNKKIKTEFNESLPSGIHYVEIHADRMPVLHNVELDFGGEIKVKRIPTVNDPEWTSDFRDDTEQMLLARTIFGEARSLSNKGRAAVGWTVKNRIENPSQWSDNYYDVILEEKQYSAFNKSDDNRPFVENPFKDKTQIDEWYECYEMAGKVMRGEVGDPTDGANHYFSNFIETPRWVKSKQAEFKIQVGNTLFYNLDWSKNGGFIKLKLLLIGLASATVLLVGVYITAEIDDLRNDSMANVAGLSAGEHFFINPLTEEISVMYFDKNGDFLRIAQITDDGYPKSSLKVSSSRDGNALGFFQDLHRKGEGYDKDDEKARQEYYNNYTTLMIMKNEHSAPKEVYRGDVHTSYWEWGISGNNRVVVYYNCGSSCLYAYEINVETKEIESEYHVY